MLHAWRLLLSSRVLVERFKLNIVLAEQVLVLAEAFQEFSLGKSTFSPAQGLRRRYTLHPGLYAIRARGLAVTLHLALLANNTRRHPPPLGCWQHGRHDGSTGGVPCITNPPNARQALTQVRKLKRTSLVTDSMVLQWWCCLFVMSS
jgi:hypothetical protein